MVLAGPDQTQLDVNVKLNVHSSVELTNVGPTTTHAESTELPNCNGPVTEESTVIASTDNPTQHSNKDLVAIHKALPNVSTLENPKRKRFDYAKSHIRQTETWDCGLACLAMVLSYHDDAHTLTTLEDVKRISKEMGLSNSIWTLDICNVLVQYGIKSQLFTSEMGVCLDYQQHDFYSQRFDEDEKRVNDLFENSEKYGLNVQERVLSLKEIQNHLVGGGVAIVLIDILTLKPQQDMAMLLQQTLCFLSTKRRYQGHYILVTHIDPTGQTVSFADPASREKRSTVTSAVFNDARQAFGTDDDIIFISAPTTQPPM